MQRRNERVKKPRRPAPRFEGLSPSSLRASRIKRQVGRYDTSPELALRRALFAAGLRFRIHRRDLPGRPDIVFPVARVAVFCDGDFWHGRNWTARRRRLLTGANPDYWVEKILRNRQRDRRNNRHLEALGWKVVRLWEADIVGNPSASAAIVHAAVSRSRVR